MKKFKIFAIMIAVVGVCFLSCAPKDTSQKRGETEVLIPDTVRSPEEIEAIFVAKMYADALLMGQKTGNWVDVRSFLERNLSDSIRAGNETYTLICDNADNQELRKLYPQVVQAYVQDSLFIAVGYSNIIQAIAKKTTVEVTKHYADSLWQLTKPIYIAYFSKCSAKMEKLEGDGKMVFFRNAISPFVDNENPWLPQSILYQALMITYGVDVGWYYHHCGEGGKNAVKAYVAQLHDLKGFVNVYNDYADRDHLNYPELVELGFFSLLEQKYPSFIKSPRDLVTMVERFDGEALAFIGFYLRYGYFGPYKLKQERL
ncbi:MAG: hypothetical protein LBD11_00390 [Candidatus Peribacteria bacterium]|jgi:hypothetical protein|nr:hypothetical protein [Candidatus Peribacteria bacterium]